MCFMTCDALPLGLLTCHPCDCCIHTPILAIAFSPYTQSSVKSIRKCKKIPI